ncbi:MAG TPA: NADH-quinone oxidoreductase subunit NuoH [Coriobacteriia bacterium]
MSGAASPLMGLVWGAAGGLGAGAAIAVAALFGVYWERKVAARIQMRYGPQQAGPFGLLQTLADTVKLVLKEEFTPTQADPVLFRRAPLLVFVPIAMSLVVLPLATGFAPLDTSIGVLFFLAVPSLSVIGILLGGWSSGNTFATLGGMRGAAQMVAYEVPRTLSVLALVVLAGSMRPLDVMSAWRPWWLAVLFVAFVVYLISSIAEMNRGPFDIPEAESELVAGYFADYAGIRWALFMMSEYGAIIGASFFGAATFLGGTHGVPGFVGFLILFLKALVLITVVIWVKWTLPRFRSDQLMSLAWKVLTPLALAQLLVAGVVAAWL